MKGKSMEWETNHVYMNICCNNCRMFNARAMALKGEKITYFHIIKNDYGQKLQCSKPLKTIIDALH